MNKRTIAALLGASPLALSALHASQYLSTELPEEAASAPLDAAMVGRGERFAISRGVAVVPIKGLLTPNFFALEKYLGWSTYHGIEESMGELSANEEVGAIILEVDSPGGLVIGLESASEAIAKASAIKPVHVLVNPLAASAAYWLASQATDIAMTPGSLVGSIGTMVDANSHVTTDMRGDQWFQMASSHARAKNPDPATDEGKAEIKRRLDEGEARFHEAVSNGRGIALADLPSRLSVSDDVADGGSTFQSQSAIERGLADSSEVRGDFYQRVFSQYAMKPRKGTRAFSAHASAAQALAQT